MNRNKREFLQILLILWSPLLVFWLIFCFSLGCCARAVHGDEVEILGGGLSYHPIDFGTSNQYSYKLTSNGRLIDNPMLGVGTSQVNGAHFTEEIFFSGKNSVNGNMTGALFIEGFEVDGLQFGPAVGIYAQQAQQFTDLNIEDMKFTRVRGVDITPIVGFDLNYKIKLSDKTYIKLTNLISPVIINSTLAIGYTY